MPHLHLTRQRRLSAFRRLAIGTWRAPRDPQAYGRVTLDVAAANRYIAAFRAATGKHLTITHMMAKAAGRLLAAVPEANALIRFGRIYLRREITVFFQVAMRDPETGQVDLSGIKLEAPHERPLAAIVDEFEAHAAAVRGGRDRELEATRRAFRWVPPLLVGKALDALGHLAYVLNLDLRRAGVPRDPYGSIMISNVGSLGLDEAFAPLIPHAHVGVIITLGAIQAAPVVRGGEVVAGEVMPIGATFDHRLLDGAHAARMIALTREWFEDPFRHFDAIPAAPPAADNPNT